MFRDIIIIIILVSIGGAIGWFGKDFLLQKNLIPPSPVGVEGLLNPTNYPALTDLKLADFPPERTIETQIGMETGLGSKEDTGVQILNAYAITLYEEKQSGERSATNSAQGVGRKEYKVVGFRILGEVVNTGEQVVKSILPTITFYDKKEAVLATKKGFLNPTTPFLPLEPNVIGGYDIIVRDPPLDLEKIEIRLKASSAEKEIPWLPLKIKDKTLATHKTSTDSGALGYYQFKGTLINDQDAVVADPTVLVWVKNTAGRVTEMQVQSYADDLLSPNKEMSVAFLVRSGNLLSDPVFEVRTFGKKYEK